MSSIFALFEADAEDYLEFKNCSCLGHNPRNTLEHNLILVVLFTN